MVCVGLVWGIWGYVGESVAGLERTTSQPSGQERSRVGKDANCRQRKISCEAMWKAKLSLTEKSGDVHL